MRVMIIRKADRLTESGALPGKELLDAMTAFHEEMAKAGVLVDGVGLKPSSKSARVSFKNGKPTVIDGPFAETKELIAGFSMLKVKSLEDALEWAKRWPPLDGDVELELRPVYEDEEIGL